MLAQRVGQKSLVLVAMLVTMIAAAITSPAQAVPDPQGELQRAREKLADTRQQLQDTNVQLADTSVQLQNAQNLNDLCLDCGQEADAELQRAVAKLEETIDQLEATIAQLRVAIDQIDEAIDILESGGQLEDVLEQLGVVDGQIQRSIDKIERAIAKVNEVIQQVETAQQLQAICGACADAAQAELDRAQSKLDRAQSKLDRARSKLDETRAQLDALEARIICPADTDGNNVVDVDDLVAVIIGWGGDGSQGNSDVNNDGIVNVDDLVGVILDWGQCPAGPQPEPVIINGFQPQTGQAGDIIQIFGRGFDPDPDNNCAVVMVGNNCSLPLRVLDVSPATVAGQDQIMTVEVGPVFEGAQPGPIMVARGQGVQGFFDANQLPPGVEVQVPEPVWVWDRDPPNGPAGDTGGDFFFPVPPPQPLWIHGEPSEGEICLIIPPDVVWGPQQKIQMTVRLHNHDTGIGHDADFPCIIIDGPPGDPLSCALAICDSIRCGFFQLAGIDVNCDVTPGPAGIKIRLRMKGPNGQQMPIDWGNFDICLVPPVQPVDVRINEIRIDQPGADNDEYFELQGTPGGSLDGLTYLVIGDGAGGSGTIEAVVDLTGQVIPPSGIFLAAENTFSIGPPPNLVTNLNFENSDNVTHMLVAGFFGADGDDLDINDDCLLDAGPWSGVVDSIALVEEPNPPASTECHYGPATIGPDGTFVPGHVWRCEPTREWRIGGFTAPTDDTPGAVNPPCPVIEITGFDPPGGQAGDIIQIFGSGFDPDPDNNCAVVMVGNNCSLPLQVLDVSPSTVAGQDQIMTAEVGPVFPQALPGPVMVATGEGAFGTFVPGVPGIEVVEPVWVWDRNPPNGPEAGSDDDFTPTPPAEPQWIHGEPEGGQMCLILPPDLVWCEDQKLAITVRAHNHTVGIGHDGFFPCIVLTGPSGGPIDCAERICDSVRCAFFQQSGIFINCDVFPQADNSVKIQIQLKNPDSPGEPLPIDWGNFDICLFPCGGGGCQWDLNGDGVVDSTDLNIANSQLGQPCQVLPPPCADFDGNGIVDDGDIQKIELLIADGPFDCPPGT